MHTSIHSGSTGNIRHPPRNGFTVSFALSPGTIGCVDPVSPLLPRLAARSGSTQQQRTLTPTMGRQNHAISPSATLPLVSHAATAHELRSPCDIMRTRQRRVHHSPPRVRDDRDTPLVDEAGWQEGTIHFRKTEEKYF